MRSIRDVASLESAALKFADGGLRLLAFNRAEYLRECADDESVDEFEFIVVDSGDDLNAVDAAVRSSLLVNPYSGSRFGNPGFVPCFETLEEYPTFFDVTFIFGDGALCIELIVPKCPGIDERLLNLCAQYASPASETAP